MWGLFHCRKTYYLGLALTRRPIYKLHELKLGVEWPFRRYEAAFWRK